MSSENRQERLAEYLKDLHQKPAEEQAQVVDAASPEEVGDFLSGDSPIELAARFNRRYREVIDMDFSDYERGRILMARGLVKEAKKLFTEALQAGDVRANVGLGDIISKTSTPETDDQMIGYYRAAVDGGYNTPEARFKLARSLYITEKHDDEADRIMDEVIRETEDPVERDFFIGYRKLMHRDNTGAIACFENTASKGHIESTRLLEQLYTALKKPGRVIRAFKRAVEFGHMHFAANVGYEYVKTGKTEDAINYFLKAVNAGHYEVLGDLTMLLINSGRLQEAKTVCDKAIEEGRIEGYLAKSMIYGYEVNYDGLAEMMRGASERGYVFDFPSQFFMLYNSGNIEGAEKLCTTGKEARTPHAKLLRAIIYFDRGDIETGQILITAALEQAGARDEMKTIAALKAAGRQQEALNMFINVLAGKIMKVEDPAIMAMIKQGFGLGQAN
jgi:tetratricopeptide (TPR) repeat protein